MSYYPPSLPTKIIYLNACLQVRPFADPAEFRETLETSLQNLDLEYIDLFGFHGINREEHLGALCVVVRSRERTRVGGGTAGRTVVVAVFT